MNFRTPDTLGEGKWRWFWHSILTAEKSSKKNKKGGGKSGEDDQDAGADKAAADADEEDEEEEEWCLGKETMKCRLCVPETKTLDFWKRFKTEYTETKRIFVPLQYTARKENPFARILQLICLNHSLVLESRPEALEPATCTSELGTSNP